MKCCKIGCENAAVFIQKLEIPHHGHVLGCEHKPVEMWTPIYTCVDHLFHLTAFDVINQETVNAVTEACRASQMPPPDFVNAALVPVALIAHEVRFYLAITGQDDPNQALPTQPLNH